ncbi:protein phosphatase 2C domain-containing protein [Streptomyces minutiscleroticus]|nr:protein phosphatase 2C domain-containing protein [Streptomyces minutiscleroticus]
MSQQGERPTGQEDDWWGELYADSAQDTGPAAAADSLDDRFASAAGTVGDGGPEPPDTNSPGPAIPPPRRAATGPHRREVPDPPGPAARPESDGTTGPADEPRTPGPSGAGVRRDASGASETDGGSERGAPGAGASSAAVPAEGAPGPGSTPGGAPSGPPVPPGPPGPSYAPLLPGGLRPRRAPWEPPERPPGPATFPPGFRPNAPAAGDRPPSPSPHPAAPPSVPPAPSGGPAASTAGPAFGPLTPPPGAAWSDTPPVPADDRSREPVRDGIPAPSRPGPAPAGVKEPDDPADAPPAPAGAEEHPAEEEQPAPHVAYVGSGPPTYAAEPGVLPAADPDALGDLVADTVLDGARYGACTLRAVSARGDSPRYRGEPRRDSLLTARFGSGDDALVLVAMATGARGTPGAHRAAAEACRWIGRAVGRSHVRLAEDLRAARRGELKSGLQRLTDRSLGRLRATAAEQGVAPEEYTATLRCLLLPADPGCRVRVFFGVGAGGLFRLRDGEWQDIEPRVAAATGEAVVGFGSLPQEEAQRKPHETSGGDRFTMDLGITTPPSPYEPAPAAPRAPFRFRASVARPGDTLLLCTAGLADPLRGEPGLAVHLTSRWSAGRPPGLAAFLADTQTRVKGYADDRTAAAVWEE